MQRADGKGKALRQVAPKKTEFFLNFVRMVLLLCQKPIVNLSG